MEAKRSLNGRVDVEFGYEAGTTDRLASFALRQQDGTSASFHTGDYNNDGEMDLVSIFDVNGDYELVIDWSIAYPTTRRQTVYSLPAPAQLVATNLLDLDGDRVDDLAFSVQGQLDGVFGERLYTIFGNGQPVDIPVNAQTISNTTIAGSGSFLIAPSTGSDVVLSNQVVPQATERWFAFETLGDGQAGTRYSNPTLVDLQVGQRDIPDHGDHITVLAELFQDELGWNS